MQRLTRLLHPRLNDAQTSMTFNRKDCQVKRRKPYLLIAVFAACAALLAVPAHAQNLPDFRTLVKQNQAAVVNISTTQSRPEGAEGFGFDLPENHPFNEFFRRFGQPNMPAPRPAQSLGSGFIISDDGTVLTNAHVVKDADEIVVRLSDQRELQAELVGLDERSDVAVLKIDASGLPTLKLGNSDTLEVGEWVLAIGSPFGLDFTATQGIVSALGRSLPSDSYVPFIQTDVAVNPGNSGGPLLNTQGQVVGINSQIYSRSGGYQGVSFAIPINTAMQVARQIESQGYVSRGWLGVSIQNVTQDLARSFGLDRPRGALVANVLEDSPAAKAGIEPGDIILEFNGQSVSSSSALPPIVGETPVGSRVPVLVLRDGKRKTLKAKIEELKDQDGRAVPARSSQDESMTGLGVQVRDLTDDERETLGIERGGVVIVGMERDGPAARAGIRKGDVIRRVGRSSIDSARQLRKLVDDLPKGKPVSVLVQRGDNPLFVAITIDD